jgi:hypothetical protein
VDVEGGGAAGGEQAGFGRREGEDVRYVGWEALAVENRVAAGGLLARWTRKLEVTVETMEGHDLPLSTVWSVRYCLDYMLYVS